MSYYGNLAGLAAAFSWLANYADTAWLARLGITSVEDAAMLLLRVYWVRHTDNFFFQALLGGFSCVLSFSSLLRS